MLDGRLPLAKTSKTGKTQHYNVVQVVSSKHTIHGVLKKALAFKQFLNVITPDPFL